MKVTVDVPVRLADSDCWTLHTEVSIVSQVQLLSSTTNVRENEKCVCSCVFVCVCVLMNRDGALR